MTDSKNAPSDALVHYGVKGMHWGVRKNTPTHADYTTKHQKVDRTKFGKGGVKRINRRMNKGATLHQARQGERRFRATTRTLAVTAALFAPEIHRGSQLAGAVIKLAGQAGVQKVAKKADTNRGRAHAAGVFGLPLNPSSGPNYAKQRRSGAYNISSL